MKSTCILIALLATLASPDAFAQTGLAAGVVDGVEIHLTWNAGGDDARFAVHRHPKPHFHAGESTLLGVVDGTEYTDTVTGPNTVHYYQVMPAGAAVDSTFRPAEVRAETYSPGEIPSVTVAGLNTTRVGRYEKFELHLELDNVYIQNPYDPADIDVFALFTSPGGDTVRINGFYDNYRDADRWKLRFSPDTTGRWEYRVYVRDAAGLGESAPGTFTAVESDHHGWIRPSDANPHYFEHDDGTSYFAVGVYSPWRNDEERFNTFAEHNANLFAIWDIMYGGFVNGTGIIEEELGRYNQEKVGRIDSLLVTLERHDIQLMYAIWPHDLFSATVWAHQWDSNPYSRLVDVDDVYSDPVVWEYQKRKYRYLVARFAHSRSMGIWELINEMNGTDGWAHGRRREAYDWVSKCDKWFGENDPYGHPVTASFSGGFGEYREELYIRNDIPNLHVYPAQGWDKKYPEDDLRSGMYNYAWASRRFWQTFEKPAIFGEAGADLSYFENDDPAYHDNYHNVIWATLANGLAGIPVWWQYPHLTERDWDHLMYLARFVEDIDFANRPYELADIRAEGADAYALDAGNDAFGWMRTHTRDGIAGTPVILTGMQDGTYDIRWYDTWTGETAASATVPVRDGTLSFTAPELPEAQPDIAFRIVRR